MSDRYGPLDAVLFGLAGKYDPDDAGMAVADARQQGDSVHLRHPHVRDDHVEGPVLELLKGLAASFDEGHIPLAAQFPQTDAEAFEDHRFVVNKEQASFHGMSPLPMVSNCR